MAQQTLTGEIACKPWNDEELLRTLYHDDGLSLRNIADQFDCHYTTVSRAMHKYGIERRDGGPMGESVTVPFATRSDGYEYWRGDTRLVLVHRLLAVAEHGFDAVTDGIVHHKNTIRWDNRPENLEIVEGHREHGHLHAQIDRQSDKNRTLSESFS